MSADPAPIVIRAATAADTALILSFIRALAEYEKLAHAVTADEATLRRHLFGQPPAAEVLIAEWGREAAGFALYFQTFSTFIGRPGLYLEDLFVKPEFRARGIGKALLARLAGLAAQRGCGRLEWAVLNWNEPAIGFYRKIGAVPMQGWTVMRLAGEGLETLAAG